MKSIEKLAPSTIRARVGALARCTDWGMRKGYLVMPDHPLRTLPDGRIAGADAHVDHAVAAEDQARSVAAHDGGEELLKAGDGRTVPTSAAQRDNARARRFTVRRRRRLVIGEVDQAVLRKTRVERDVFQASQALRLHLGRAGDGVRLQHAVLHDAQAARAFGAEVVLTSPDCPSGTDRVAEVARALGLADDAVLVNVQGDEPAVHPEALALLARAFEAPGVEMATLARVLRETRAREVIIAMPSAPGAVRRDIVERCRAANVRVTTLPGLPEHQRRGDRSEAARGARGGRARACAG